MACLTCAIAFQVAEAELNRASAAQVQVTGARVGAGWPAKQEVGGGAAASGTTAVGGAKKKLVIKLKKKP